MDLSQFNDQILLGGFAVGVGAILWKMRVFVTPEELDRKLTEHCANCNTKKDVERLECNTTRVFDKMDELRNSVDAKLDEIRNLIISKLGNGK